MKPAALICPSTEVELKLALPSSDPAGLAKRLAKVAVLAGCKPTQQHLHNVYYDSPEQALRQQRVALRMRRIGSGAKPQWLQTLKTAGRDDSALSQRGEWEVPVPSAQLALKALHGTAWDRIDPDGTLFQALTPVFVTSFERTNWSVRGRDGSLIQVSLDFGQITAGERITPICELELELQAGHPTSLFDLAQAIAATIAVLPSHASKAQRGYALAQNCLDIPLRAQPPKLSDDLSVPQAAGRVLREMFCQFTGNLNALLHSDAPEVVHQARVGWRRFKSALRLFKPALVDRAPPPWQALEVLLATLGQLRDLDVAHVDTLPPLEDAYTGGDCVRTQTWQTMMQALMDATQLQRKTVRYALQQPTVGANLLAATRWLIEMFAANAPDDAGAESKTSLRRWSRHRIARLQRQLKVARHDTDNPTSQHRVRILAKRLRYCVEALRSVLPKQRATRLCLRATSLQMGLGTRRDVQQAGVLLAELEVDHGLVEFLRGVAVGQARSD
jgi:inorganic triphosphatase YgiF